MDDHKLIELAREAGWSACDPAMKEKLLKFGRLVYEMSRKEKCTLCNKNSTEGCSRLNCPSRKTVTAAPPAEEDVENLPSGTIGRRPKLSDEWNKE